MNRNILVVIIILLVGIVGYLGYRTYYMPRNAPVVTDPDTTTPTDTEPVACTMDAMQCPDGTYVGRTGPKCEFAACPGNPAAEDKIQWLVYMGDTQSNSVLNIDKLATRYMHVVNSPPAKITISEEVYTCNLAGTDESMAVSGKTEQHVVGRYEYCVTMQSEGAAGSVFNTYQYVTAYNEGSIIFDFTMQMPQCANYSETERKACEAERAIFSIDSFVNQMFTAYNWSEFKLNMVTN